MTTYYRRIQRDTWLKSASPSKSGTWITEREYRIQHAIEREQARQKARHIRRQVKRQLRSE